MLTAGTERIDFMHDFEFTESPVTGAVETRSYLAYNPEKSWSLGHTQEFKLELETNTQLLLTSLRASENLYEQIELLHTLIRLKGLSFDTGFGGAEETVQVVDLLNEVYTKAGESSQSKIQWAVIRHAAGLLDKVDISLSDAVTDILVRQKQIAVGKAYSEDSIISRPGSYTEVMDKIRQFCGEDIRDRVLTQEVLIYLGLLIKAEPQLFKGLLTLRVSYFILLLTSELARELQVTQNEAYEYLMQLSPFEIKNRLRQVLTEYEEMNQILKQQESLRVKQPEKDIEWVVAPVSEERTMPAGGWRRKRQMEGGVNRVPKDFYPNVWGLLRHCKGLIIGDKLERRNRLDSHIILSEMTPGEKNFALQIEHLLNKIVAPEYRQVNIEALMELAAIAQRNPELQVEEYIVLDVLVGHAVRLNWQGKYPERADKYDEDKAAAWQAFYNTSPYVCASHVLDAFRFLTKFG
jgi:phosphorylase kinase alpha/beta subunit